jgi:hypothetical protein
MARYQSKRLIEPIRDGAEAKRLKSSDLFVAEGTGGISGANHNFQRRLW